MMTTPRTLKEIEVGHTVVIAPKHSNEKWRPVTVEKITATQFVAGGIRFNRRSGVKIGDGDTWSAHTQIAECGGMWDSHLMTPEEAEQHNQERIAEIKRSNLVYALTNLTRSQLTDVPTENLVAALTLLGVEQ